MCPWPRIQAAMLDEDSLVVTYNDWRGEPRSHGAKKAAAAGLAGRRLRRLQPLRHRLPDGHRHPRRAAQDGVPDLRAQCIDACDDVMDEDRARARPDLLRHPQRLQRQHGDRDEPGDRDDRAGTGARRKRSLHADSSSTSTGTSSCGTRTLIYAGIWVAIGIGLLVALLSPRPAGGERPARPQPGLSVTLSDGSIRNGYTVKLLNMIPEPRPITLSIEGLPGATMEIRRARDACLDAAS